jgi:hypothetical protein
VFEEVFEVVLSRDEEEPREPCGTHRQTTDIRCNPEAK